MAPAACWASSWASRLAKLRNCVRGALCYCQLSSDGMLRPQKQPDLMRPTLCAGITVCWLPLGSKTFAYPCHRATPGDKGDGTYHRQTGVAPPCLYPERPPPLFGAAAGAAPFWATALCILRCLTQNTAPRAASTRKMKTSHHGPYTSYNQSSIGVWHTPDPGIHCK